MQRLAIKPAFAKAAKSDRNSIQKGKKKKYQKKPETKQKKEREIREKRAKSKAAAWGWWGISPKKEPWELPSFEGQHFQEPRELWAPGRCGGASAAPAQPLRWGWALLVSPGTPHPLCCSSWVGWGALQSSGAHIPVCSLRRLSPSSSGVGFGECSLWRPPMQHSDYCPESERHL